MESCIYNMFVCPQMKWAYVEASLTGMEAPSGDGMRRLMNVTSTP